MEIKIIMMRTIMTNLYLHIVLLVENTRISSMLILMEMWTMTRHFEIREAWK